MDVRSVHSVDNSPKLTRRPETKSLSGSGNGQAPSAMASEPSTTASSCRRTSTTDDLATNLLATLQGGLLLAQVQRSTRPLETVVDTLLALAVSR